MKKINKKYTKQNPNNNNPLFRYEVNKEIEDVARNINKKFSDIVNEMEERFYDMKLSYIRINRNPDI